MYLPAGLSGARGYFHNTAPFTVLFSNTRSFALFERGFLSCSRSVGTIGFFVKQSGAAAEESPAREPDRRGRSLHGRAQSPV